MADRTVKVRLEAVVGQYTAAMAQASASTKKLVADTNAATKAHSESFKKIGMYSGLAAVGIGAAFVGAERTIMAFDKQLSNVASVSNATAKQMSQLRDAAIAAGASTKLAGVSASEAASAEAELVKAGVSVHDVLGGALVGSLSLASAGQLDFADAATIAAQSMNIFKLGGQDVEHIADVLAAAANKSAADVGQMGDAMRQGGLVAAQTGLSFEETAGAIAAFADNALIGSDAGTSLKSMLQRLTPQSEEAQKLMDQLGFSAYDAQGNFVGLEKLAGRLQEAFSGMTVEQRNSAMATLFGSDAVRGANVLYAEGADGIRKYVDAVDDQGAASRMAAKQMDNLSGDIENLGGAIEAAILKNGSGATDSLRFMAQAATGAVNGFSDLPGPLTQVAGGMVALTGAGLGVLGIVGTLIPRVREAREALDGMGRAGQVANTGLGWAGKAGGYAVGIAAFAVGVSALANQVDRLLHKPADLDAVSKALVELAQGSKGAFADVAKATRTAEPELARFVKLVQSGELTSKQSGLGRALDDLDKGLTKIVNGGAPQMASKSLKDFADNLGLVPKDLLPWLNDYQGALKKSAASAVIAGAAQKEAADGSNDLAGGLEGVKGSAQDAADAMKAYLDAIDAYLGQLFSVNDAQQDFTMAMLDADETMAKLDATSRRQAIGLDQGTKAGIDAQNMLQGLVEKSADVISAMAQQGATEQELTAARKAHADAVAAEATKLGFSAEVAGQLRDQILSIPVMTTATVNVNTGDAMARVNQMAAALQRINGMSVAASIKVATSIDNRATAFGWQGHASGGLAGFGTPGPSDTVPAMLTPGEFVVRKGAVDAIGVPTLKRLNSLGFASGGLVPSMFPGGKQGDKPTDAWSVTQFARSVDAFSDSDWEKALRKRLATFKQFSSEWQDAYKALVDFQKSKADEEKQIAEDTAKFLEAHYERRQEALDIQFREGAISVDAYMGALAAREARLVGMFGFWSKEAAQVRDEMRSVLDDVQRDVEDAAKKAQDTADDRLDKLNSLLDDEQRLRKQMEQSAKEHADRMAEIQSSFVADQQQILDDRRQQLLGWADVSQRVTASWGNTASALTGNIRSQMSMFADWADALDAARKQGLSEQVIGLLGLDEGPQALGQLKMFTSATASEIADLNKAVEDRTAQAGDRVSAEAQSSYGKVSEQLYALAEKHAAEVEKLTEDFLAEQKDLTDQLAVLGTDQGRSYGSALEEGLRSSIPGIQAAAQAARDAMTQLQQAQAAQQQASSRMVNVAADTPVVVNGVVHTASEWGNLFGQHANLDGSWAVQAGTLPGHASGTPYVPVTGPALIHQGERIFSVPDNRQLIAAVQAMGSPNFNVSVFVGGKPIRDEVKVVIRDMNTSSVIAGAH